MTSLDHVAYQDGSVDFYVPELFPHGLYYNANVPMLTADLFRCIEKSRTVCRQFYHNHISCLFWKNHPVERVCVSGLVINHQWKELLKTKEEFLLITVDDCSSPSDEEPVFLICKCSKELFVNSGLQQNLSRKRIRVHGSVDFKHNELSVEHLEICGGLTAEIQHWEKALELRDQLDIPWQIDQGSLTQLYSQQNEVQPNRLYAHNFIRNLEFENEKNNIEILSPCEEYWEVCVLDSSSVVSKAIPQDTACSDIEKISSISSCYEVQKDDSVPEVTDIASYNNTQARITLLRHLLGFHCRKISRVDLYQREEIHLLIDQVTRFRFGQQSLARLKPMEQLKSDTFVDLLNKLVDVGLLIYVNQNVVNIEPLKNLHNYCTKRLLALLKLKCHSGTIAYDHIRRKLHSPKLSKRAIIDIFKESLRVILEKHPRIVSGWWIQMTAEDSSIIHFEYQAV